MEEWRLQRRLLIQFGIVLAAPPQVQDHGGVVGEDGGIALTTWFRMVDETLIGACVPSRR